MDPSGQTDFYNAHIEGYIVPLTNETYTLTLTADDGVRLWFDGVLAIDKWFCRMVPQVISGPPHPRGG
ncbi:PA14 domain-containing protein [Desulfosporosinus hippei]|uniref:PA14 domain-containing protein n=1 Tax=Desulfosporosinus hippei TaxID=569859 RepID=UPI000B882137|nr:PA14 domain-containing protein [Desulfosporosinus hippei]